MTVRSAAPLSGVLRADWEPGSNVVGRIAFADERYLLPDLRSGRALYLGLPRGLDAARFVARLEPGARAVFLSTDAGVAEAVAAEAGSRAPAGAEVEAGTVPAWGRLPPSVSPVSVAAVGTGAGAPGSAAYGPLTAALEDVLGRDGVVSLEARGYRDALRARKMRRILTAADFEAAPPLWMLRISGSLRMAVEAGKVDTARRLLGWLGRGDTLQRRLFRIGTRVLDRTRLLGPFLARNRLLLFRRSDAAGRERTDGPAVRGGRANGGRPDEPTPLWPPPYLRPVLAEAGLDPDRYRVGFHVHGRYDSNKVAFILFDRDDGGRPRHLVKATRAPRFNHRLENEHRSLTQVRDRGYLPPRAVPEPTVLAHHGGLAMLGLRFLAGRPMREVTAAGPGCPLVQGIVGHLQTLATASARRDPSTAPRLREGLRHLQRRFEEIYPVPRPEGAFLRRRVERLRQGAAVLPLVFRHGDAGIWNVLAEDDEPVLLDWEAGEPAGMPLWDLFYFLRSVGSWRSKLRGDRDVVRSYEQHFLGPSPLRRYQDRVVERYRRCLGIPVELVEPLFYTCWMHRALRQAMQMRPAAVDGGFYYRLLLRCIRRREETSGRGAR